MATTCFAHASHADTIPIEIVDRTSNRIILDGRLGDWRRFTELTGLDSSAQVVSGRERWTGDVDAGIAFALARDNTSLFIAAEVRDDQLVRLAQHSTLHDALVLSLAVQVGSRTVGYDIAIQPGFPGQYPGAVTFRGSRSGAVRGARVVEENQSGGGGFTIEVEIPWQALPSIRDNLASLRGRMAYHDADSPARPGIETVLATGGGDGSHYEQMAPARGATSATTPIEMLAQFRQAQGLTSTEPFMDRSGNIAGDPQLERVAVFPRFIVVAGPGIAGGNRYAFVEHPVTTAAQFVETALRDVTGDGRLDVILRGRVDGGGMTREILYVYGSPTGSDQLEQLFAHELSRTVGAMRVVNRGTFEQGPRVRVTYASVEGFTQQNYPHMADTAVLGALTPWSDQRSVSYRWSDSLRRFEIAASDPNPNRAPTAVAGNAATTATPGSTVAVAPADVQGVLTLARTRLNIGASVQPDFSAEANVAEDRQPETVQIFGRNLIVAGRAYLSGRSYYSVELPEGFTVLSLTLADLTNDGQAEAIVRTRRTVTTQVRGNALEVVKEFLLAYSFDSAHRGRVFSAEISRTVGSDAIVNEPVLPAPGARNGAITIRPGRARGWTEQSYVFRDTPPQGFLPLLLPWQTPSPVTYRWNGQALAP
ncbi:MAG: hypothetical protein Q8Q09_11990 [Deltaproteobacteria bacterium]|nr:hypothetical protein [Deltaproteobacteria bacterium]